MATQSNKTKRELVALAREQSDVLAFADRHREIEVLPEGLETTHVTQRKRGNRTDRDCIDEICELIAQGITVMASVRYVGVPYATWHKWTKLNHEKSVPSISDIQYFSIQMLRLPPSSVLHRIFTRYCLPDAAARVRADNIQ